MRRDHCAKPYEVLPVQIRLRTYAGAHVIRFGNRLVRDETGVLLKCVRYRLATRIPGDTDCFTFRPVRRILGGLLCVDVGPEVDRTTCDGLVIDK